MKVSQNRRKNEIVLPPGSTGMLRERENIHMLHPSVEMINQSQSGNKEKSKTHDNNEHKAN